MLYIALLLLILFQPFQTALVRQMLHLEVLELYVEAVAVRTSSHHTHLNWSIVLHPGIAHHGVSLVVERIENLNGIETANGFYPDVRNRLVEGNYTPVAGLVSHHGTEVVLAVYIFDTCLDVVFMVDAEHQSSLVETFFVLTGNLYLGFELTAVGCIIERSIIYGETIVRDTPIVALWR